MSLKYVVIYVNEDSHGEKRKEGRDEAQHDEFSGGPPLAARHHAKQKPEPRLRSSRRRRAAIRA
jgi:hypothetical protein